MKNIFFIFVFLIAVTVSANAQSDTTKEAPVPTQSSDAPVIEQSQDESVTAGHEYTTAEAKDHPNEMAVVTGTVAQVNVSQKGIVYLNFDDKHPNQTFSIVVFAKDADAVGSGLSGGYEGLANKKVRVTGKIEMYKDKPQIVVKDASQITVVE